MYQSASFFSFLWVTVTELHRKQHKEKDAGFQYLFRSGARRSGLSYFCADLTFKVNSCEQFNSLMHLVIVPYVHSFYGSVCSCVFRAGDGTCLKSETYICDGRSGIKVSPMRRKSTKKTTLRSENTVICWTVEMEQSSWVCSSSVHQIPSDLFQWLPHNTTVKHTNSPSWPSWITYLGGYLKDVVFCSGKCSRILSGLSQWGARVSVFSTHLL